MKTFPANGKTGRATRAQTGTTARPVQLPVVAAGETSFVVPITPAPFDLLTDRELEVIKLIVQDVPVKQIGDRLGMKLKTAECHVTRARNKLKMDSRIRLTHLALERGLVRNLYEKITVATLHP